MPIRSNFTALPSYMNHVPEYNLLSYTISRCWGVCGGLSIPKCHINLMILCPLNAGMWEGEAAEWAEPAKGLYVWTVAEPLLPLPASMLWGAGQPATSCLCQHRPHIQPTVAFLCWELFPTPVTCVSTKCGYMSVWRGCQSRGVRGQTVWHGGVQSETGGPWVSIGARIHWGNL